MDATAFRATLSSEIPPADLPPTLTALWWDAKGDWTTAHALVDELETQDGMAVHAYLHRKEGDSSNAAYWYSRAGRRPSSATLEEEWAEIVSVLLASSAT